MSDGVQLDDDVLRPGRPAARRRVARGHAPARPGRDEERPDERDRDLDQPGRRDAAGAPGLRGAHVRRARARRVWRARRDRRAARDPGRARALRPAEDAAGDRPAAHRRVRLLVRRRRGLACDGRGRAVRGDRPRDDVDRSLLRARASGLRPLGRRARLLELDREPRLTRAAADRERPARRPEPQRRARVCGRALVAAAPREHPRADLRHAGPPRLRVRHRSGARRLLAARRSPSGSISATSAMHPRRSLPASSSTSCPRRASGSTAT